MIMRLLIRYIRPDLHWVRIINRSIFFNESLAGLVAAVIIIPQAAALASLAGMPAQYGIYTSIFAVMAAALFGSSWQSLSGPNTAVAIMVLGTVVPFANMGTQTFIGLVFVLTLFVGLVQVVMALSRTGVFLELVSHSVVSAVTHAVGILIIISAGWGFMGVQTTPGEHFLVKIWNLFHDIGRANLYSVSVGIVTLAVAIVMRRIYRRYALVIAMAAGIGASELLNYLVGSATTQIELLGNIPLDYLPFSKPNLLLDDFYVIQQLIIGACAIAFVGVMQTAVIAKTLSERSGEHVDINREIFGQAVSNIVASFTSGFAGSASFNRSAAHYEAGAKTPLAAILSGFFLLAIVLGAAPLIARMSTPTMSAILIMVGWGLFDFRDVKRVCHVRSEAYIFVAVFLTSLLLGLSEAVFIGVGAAIAVYLSHVSKPTIVTVTIENGHSLIQVTGDLFFGSLHSLTKALAAERAKDSEKNILAIDICGSGYVDAAAVHALHQESMRRDRAGGKVVLHLAARQMENYKRQGHWVTQVFSPADVCSVPRDAIVELHAALNPA